MDNVTPNKSLTNRHDKDTRLTVNCILIGGLIPYFSIQYQNRHIEGFFPRSIWNNEQAIIEMAKKIIEERHIVEPAKSNGHE